jgi:metallophosphoesterase (TIGR00282 family)
MAMIRIAFLGDVVAAPGRRVLQQQLPTLREDHEPDVIIVNAENVAHGSGITPDLYKKIRSMGVDAITLGDHALREPGIVDILQRPEEPIVRPANMPIKAPGRPYLCIPPSGGRTRNVYVFAVLGRLFMNFPADEPFNAADAVLQSLPEQNPIVIIDAHMEATSEKAAFAHHVAGRASAVLGTHTHVPTADARILKNGTAFMTDVGMCGPYDSIIGRDPAAVVRHLSTGQFSRYGIGRGDERLCGVLVDVSEDTGRAARIERVEYAADPKKEPFNR